MQADLLTRRRLHLSHEQINIFFCLFCVFALICILGLFYLKVQNIGQCQRKSSNFALEMWFPKPETSQMNTSGGQVLNLPISASWRQNYTIYSVLIMRICISKIIRNFPEIMTLYCCGDVNYSPCIHTSGSKEHLNRYTHNIPCLVSCTLVFTLL